MNYDDKPAKIIMEFLPMLERSNRLIDWVREYGRIFGLKRFTNTIPIISGHKLIKDLLNKKSNIFNSRSASIVAQLIMKEDHLLVMNYWKR